MGKGEVAGDWKLLLSHCTDVKAAGVSVAPIGGEVYQVCREKCVGEF